MTPAQQKPGLGLPWVLAIAAAIVGLTAMALVSTGSLPGNNVHAVIPGEVYRGAQPSAAQLRDLSERYGLASVVAARPPRPKKPWYEEETREAAALGLVFHSVELDPNRMPPRSRLQELVALIDDSPRPLLLHCRVGVERSGLAGAVALLLHGVPPEEARAQFGLRFGYVPWLSRTDLPRVVDRYAVHLEAHGLVHSPQRFRDWVDSDYVADFYDAEISLREPLRSPQVGRPIELGVRIANRSPEPILLRSTLHRGVHVGIRVTSLDPDFSYDEPARELVDAGLAPGSSVDVDLAIALPPRPGRYRITVDLVDEGLAWFAEMGSRPLVLELVIPDDATARGRAPG